MKKTLLIMIYTLLLLVMMLAIWTSTAMAAGGSGTPGDPYQIETQAELQAMSGNLSAHYILVDDIVCSGTFTPIGTDTTPFTGSFNGQSNSYTVSNLTIDLPAIDNVGLFGYVDSGAVIENVALENVNIRGSMYVGGLVGNNSGAISNSHATGMIDGSGSAGGLVGYNSNAGSISKSYYSGGIDGGAVIGGLVGENDGTIDNSYATGGVVASDSAAGGLVALNDEGTITNCYATGMVRGDTWVGGLAGVNSNIISNCYATGGLICGDDFVGGLVTVNMGSTTDCFWSNNLAISGGGIREDDQRAFFSASHPVYATWDFDTVWGMADGSSYPYMGNPGVAAPVFEIWTIVFVSIGLIGIIAFIWYRRRRVSVVLA